MHITAMGVKGVFSVPVYVLATKEERTPEGQDRTVATGRLGARDRKIALGNPRAEVHLR